MPSYTLTKAEKAQLKNKYLANIMDVNNKIAKNDAEGFLEGDEEDLQDLMVTSNTY